MQLAKKPKTSQYVRLSLEIPHETSSKFPVPPFSQHKPSDPPKKTQSSNPILLIPLENLQTSPNPFQITLEIIPNSIPLQKKPKI